MSFPHTISRNYDLDDYESDPEHVPGSSYTDTPLSGPLMSIESLKDIYSIEKEDSIDTFESMVDIVFDDSELSVEDLAQDIDLIVDDVLLGTVDSDEEANEGLGSEKWRHRKKHIFIVTSSGKPVYSRYGDEFKLADIMGAMVAIMSFVGQNGDQIHYVSAGKYKVVFSVHGPYYFIMVASTIESPKLLKQQLNYMHSQLISFLTIRAHAILERSPQYDIKNNMLGGTDRIFDSLASTLNYSASFYFNSIHCMRISSQVRSIIGNTLLGERQTGIFFVILLGNGRLLQLLRPKKFSLSASDLHLIINFVNCSETLKDSEACVSPICLPGFDENGSFYQYISYLWGDLCLILLSNSAEYISIMKDVRNSIKSSLVAVSNVKSHIDKSLSFPDYYVSKMNIKGLLHFLYNSELTSQMTSPAWEPPYNIKSQKKRLSRVYQHVHSLMHSMNNPHKTISYTTEYESVIGWVTNQFQLIATFSPLVSQRTMVEGCNQILRWIEVEESKLFILHSPVWQ